MQKIFLSCDWGTTAFRLRLVEGGSFRVINEEISKEGISLTHDLWKKQNAAGSCSSEAFFLNVLQQSVNRLENKTGISLSSATLLISGMASSSIGIRELPYASLPFSLDGSDAYAETIPTGAAFGGEVILISGVRTESDVMRGEETQMVGLSSFFAPDEDEEVVSIFPGTHSKHITTKGGKLVDIRTYITGELFDLMVNHSILKDGISASARPMDENDATSFRKGVDQSKEFNLLNSLFRVRVNHLFKSLDSERNFYFLSGLLIGSELSGLANRNLQLCCGSNLYRLYRMAIEESGLVNSTTFIPPEVMDMAVVQGQWKIFSTFKNK